MTRWGVPSDDLDLTLALLRRASCLISQFLGEGLDDHRPARQPEPFSVSPSALAFVGFPWEGRKNPITMKSSLAAKWRYRGGAPAPGSLATLLLPGLIGKLVYIRQIKRELDWSEVSSSVDGDPYFSRDGHGRFSVSPAGTSCWHIVRIHNFCRPMGSPEAVCERVGSLMHTHHEPKRHVDAGALMDAVLLREAGVSCIGHARLRVELWKPSLLQ
jgi:hypothetical protein